MSILISRSGPRLSSRTFGSALLGRLPRLRFGGGASSPVTSCPCSTTSSGRWRLPNPEEDHLAEGVRLVREELVAVLARAGVESYSPAGEAFDPDWHEAMLTRPGEAGQVLEVLEKGYRLNGQVLRPARVVVGAAEE